VLDLFKNVDRWCREFGQGPQHVRQSGLRSDSPEHTIYRRLATGAFTPQAHRGDGSTQPGGV
jgi:cytochrome P450